MKIPVLAAVNLAFTLLGAYRVSIGKIFDYQVGDDYTHGFGADPTTCRRDQQKMLVHRPTESEARYLHHN